MPLRLRRTVVAHSQREVDERHIRHNSHQIAELDHERRRQMDGHLARFHVELSLLSPALPDKLPFKRLVLQLDSDFLDLFVTDVVVHQAENLSGEGGVVLDHPGRSLLTGEE